MLFAIVLLFFEEQILGVSILKMISNKTFVNWFLESHSSLRKLICFSKSSFFPSLSIESSFVTFWRDLFLVSALISEISVRKKFCKVSNLSVKTDKLSFGLRLWSLSIGVEIYKSAVLCDSFPLDSASVKCSNNSFDSWFFFKVFVEVLIKNNFITSLYRLVYWLFSPNQV